MSQDIQQSPTYRFWSVGAFAKREDQGQCITYDRIIEHSTSEYCGTFPTGIRWTFGDCSGAQTTSRGADCRRQHRSADKTTEESYSFWGVTQATANETRRGRTKQNTGKKPDEASQYVR